MESFKPKVLVIGAATSPWNLDLKHGFGGRFHNKVYIEMPGQAARRQLLHLALGGLDHTVTLDQFDQITAQTDEYSGHDIFKMVRTALKSEEASVRNAKFWRPVCLFIRLN